jgi:hypothetical protein
MKAGWRATRGFARRISWSCFALVIAFAAGFLQFGLADRLALSPDKRVNDGDRATFFAVHINPYYVFSEDFHLYAVRAKRVMDRGWTDSPLISTENEGINRSAPLQTGLMMLAVATDGRPVPYSIFIVGVLTVAWSVLYFAASRWLPRSVSPLTIPIAVLLSVLFESFDGLFHPSSEFGQWPVHRGLRMATLAWTSPLLLSLVLASVSLLFRRERPAGRIGFVTAVLLVLALSDTWAFLLGSSCVAMVVLGLGALGVRNWRAETEGASLAWKCGAALSLAGLLALATQQATSGPLKGDVLTRAGFGPEWQDSAGSSGESREFIRTMRSYGAALLLFIAAISIRAAVGVSRRPWRVQIDAQLRHAKSEWWELVALAGVPIAGFASLIGALTVMGMDEYHLFQFVWRLEFVLLFCGIVVLSEAIKLIVRHIFTTAVRSNFWEVALAGSLLAALFIYHNARIYRFVSRTVASEFFLTKDEEQLRDWLQEREQSLGDYSLVTASHELNYLCAYWTRADLLLPEGFPYHSAATNEEIEDRMAEVLRTYGATPERWLEFNLHRHVWDQWSWAESRLLSARHGYMYYLMHRGLLLEGTAVGKIKSGHSKRTTPYYAETRLKHDRAVTGGQFLDHRAGIEAAKRIAERLKRSSTPSAKPDIIVVDEVSCWLGKPDLEDYVREFKHGSLEAWVLKRSIPQTASSYERSSRTK